MSTPKEEVERSLVNTVPGLKPDKNTTQAPKAPAGAGPTNSLNAYPRLKEATGKAFNDGTKRLVKSLVSSNPQVAMVKNMASYASTPMNYNPSNVMDPNASKVIGTTVNGKFVSNAQAEVNNNNKLAADITAKIQTPAAPQKPLPPIAQVPDYQNNNQVRTIVPLKTGENPYLVGTGYTGDPPVKPLLVGDRNTFTNGKGKTSAIPTDGSYDTSSVNIVPSAPVQAAPAQMAQRSFLAPAPSRVTDSDRAKYSAEMSNIMNDPNARLSPTLARAKADLINGAQDGQYAAERSTEANRFGLVNTDMNNVNALDQETMRGQNQSNLQDRSLVNQTALEAQRQDAPQQITNADGDVFSYRPGGNATPVTDADGKQIRGATANQTNPRLTALVQAAKMEAAGAPLDGSEYPTPYADELRKELAVDAPSQAAPYPDGHRLTGPDGKKYIVKNGRPELVK